LPGGATGSGSSPRAACRLGEMPERLGVRKREETPARLGDAARESETEVRLDGGDEGRGGKLIRI